jgi:hypothetical protein
MILSFGVIDGDRILRKKCEVIFKEEVKGNTCLRQERY